MEPPQLRCLGGSGFGRGGGPRREEFCCRVGGTGFAVLYAIRALPALGERRMGGVGRGGGVGRVTSRVGSGGEAGTIALCLKVSFIGRSGGDSSRFLPCREKARHMSSRRPQMTSVLPSMICFGLHRYRELIFSYL